MNDNEFSAKQRAKNLQIIKLCLRQGGSMAHIAERIKSEFKETPRPDFLPLGDIAGICLDILATAREMYANVTNERDCELSKILDEAIEAANWDEENIHIWEHHLSMEIYHHSMARYRVWTDENKRAPFSEFYLVRAAMAEASAAYFADDNAISKLSSVLHACHSFCGSYSGYISSIIGIIPTNHLDITKRIELDEKVFISYEDFVYAAIEPAFIDILYSWSRP